MLDAFLYSMKQENWMYGKPCKNGAISKKIVCAKLRYWEEKLEGYVILTSLSKTWIQEIAWSFVHSHQLDCTLCWTVCFRCKPYTALLSQCFFITPRMCWNSAASACWQGCGGNYVWRCRLYAVASVAVVTRWVLRVSMGRTCLECWWRHEAGRVQHRQLDDRQWSGQRGCASSPLIRMTPRLACVWTRTWVDQPSRTTTAVACLCQRPWYQHVDAQGYIPHQRRCTALCVG